MTQRVKAIAVTNRAGFVLSFDVHRKAGHHSAETDHYPIDKTKKMELQGDHNGRLGYIKGLQPGDKIRPKVFAVMGTEKYGDYVTYDPDGGTATYSVTGTTLVFSVKLE